MKAKANGIKLPFSAFIRPAIATATAMAHNTVVLCVDTLSRIEWTTVIKLIVGIFIGMEMELFRSLSLRVCGEMYVSAARRL